MAQSILTSVKKVLGLAEDYTAFDVDVTMHINSVFGTLNQLGVGPTTTFMIEDKSSTWEEFIEDNDAINAVKTYMYLKVRLVFDPPPTSFGIAAMQDQIAEHEWRLNVEREDRLWLDPTLPTS